MSNNQELSLNSKQESDTIAVAQDQDTTIVPETMSPQGPSTSTGKKPGRRGRKPAKVDQKVKLERSRQSARECRARKKLRYQYLEELVASRERSIYHLRAELNTMKEECQKLDSGNVTETMEKKYIKKQ